MAGFQVSINGRIWVSTEAGAAHVGGGDPGGARVPVPESPRVPEVEVVDAEPVHDARGYAGDDGRHPHYRDPALEAARVAAPP